jgi:hypothetical protein
VVVRAEQATAAAFDVIDAFLLWERSHDGGGDVHAVAEKFRKEAPSWFATARALTKAYKANRTPDNKVALQTALAVLDQAVREANRHLAPRAQVLPMPGLPGGPPDVTWTGGTWTAKP